MPPEKIKSFSTNGSEQEAARHKQGWSNKNSLWVWMMKSYFKPQLQSAKCREHLILSCYQQLLSVNLPICFGINPWTIFVNLNWVSLIKCNNYQCTVRITREKQQIFINFNWKICPFSLSISCFLHIHLQQRQSMTHFPLNFWNCQFFFSFQKQSSWWLYWD